MTSLQPLLHDQVVTLAAPTQVWSDAGGAIGSSGVHGYWTGDQRVVSAVAVSIDDVPIEPISVATAGAGTTTFSALLRGLDAHGADPDVRLDRRRTVTASSITEELRLENRLVASVDPRVVVRIRPDASGMDGVKGGAPASPVVALPIDGGATWHAGSTVVTLSAPGALVTVPASGPVELCWDVSASRGADAVVTWTVSVSSPDAVVTGATSARPWTLPNDVADDRLRRWITRASDDLDALRMQRTEGPDDVFLAAGAPWFFTLFGRDSIWAARFLLPIDVTTAAGTLRVLAGLQGTRVDPDTAEQPGKIMHELRQASLAIDNDEIALPPLYYGTVDATPLWICLLHDAWRAGLPATSVRELLPALEAALAWMRDFGDSDGDGLLEYVDESGRGLSNQGWKDSGDSVQWRDGSLAEGPIALCEVQAYAYEAAVHGADLLDAFDRPGGDEWRAWAGRLAERFRETFWLADEGGRYPAIALAAAKRPVDTVTSNIGHLVGTGLLTAAEERIVADRLVAPDMSSGFGLRTLSTTSAGYWPLSYHGGSVWAHDTAVAIAGLTRAGLDVHARRLAEGLLAAAVAFDFRMPELHAGDAAADRSRPAPYPAACRPQAWSAAAAFPVWVALR
jgi:glycogen debranching enzyme